MRNDEANRAGSILRKMRASAAAYLPEGAFLRRDRGDALLVTNAAASVPGFISEPRGGLTALVPDDTWLLDFERAHSPAGHFSQSLYRFAGQPPTPEARALFIRGAKLAEARPSAGEAAGFDRAVRNLAAVALRTGAGGGIYALAVLDEMLEIC